MITEATWRLALTEGLGNRTWQRLHDAFGSDAAIVAQAPHALARVPGVGPRRAQRLAAAMRAADPSAAHAACRRHDARLLRLGTPPFPPLLAAIPDAPMVLWARGDIDVLRRPGVALVGSRRATPYGIAHAGRFAGQFADAGLTVISGGARGIDAEAHRAALRAGGPTIVVLGCGFDHAYPPEHRALFDEITAHGGSIITEHACAVAPRPGYFPRRNRLISGLALAVIVIEAAARSGALITARLAVEEHGRDVFAVPGRVDDVMSRGCLALVHAGEAALALDPGDVVEALAPDVAALLAGAHETAAANATPSAPSTSAAHAADAPARSAALSPTARVLIDLVRSGVRTAPELVERCTSADVDVIQQELTTLELTGELRHDAAGYVVPHDASEPLTE